MIPCSRGRAILVAHVPSTAGCHCMRQRVTKDTPYAWRGWPCHGGKPMESPPLTLPYEEAMLAGGMSTVAASQPPSHTENTVAICRSKLYLRVPPTPKSGSVQRKRGRGAHLVMRTRKSSAGYGTQGACSVAHQTSALGRAVSAARSVPALRVSNDGVNHDTRSLKWSTHRPHPKCFMHHRDRCCAPTMPTHQRVLGSQVPESEAKDTPYARRRRGTPQGKAHTVTSFVIASFPSPSHPHPSTWLCRNVNGSHGRAVHSIGFEVD
ncbi:hypothetical protein BD779DRAFT_1544708 [Infundibulicybe gibba]|nr:hypothetical protein BD779DRAFT_1544708 [Infundibulicybe gibba]